MTAGRRFCGYIRVSTQQQGRSGRGLDAQRTAIEQFLRADDRLLMTHTEIESGRKPDRPKLAEALAFCRKTGATLLVAKVDRLTRNLPFLRSLIDSGVDVAFCDLPGLQAGAVGRFMLSQLALIAELEAGLISERTKAALAAAKARGVMLGGDRGYRPAHIPADLTRSAAIARTRASDHAAHALMGEIEAIHAEHAQPPSLHAIARALAARGTPTPRGGTWTASAVRRALARVRGHDDASDGSPDRET